MNISSRTHPPSLATRALLVLVGAVVAIHNLGVGAGPASIELDPSWTSVVAWATAHGLQFGHDIVFTYGPLGFLHPGASYVSGMYPAFLIGQLTLAVLFGLSTSALLMSLEWRQRLFYCVAGFVCAPWIGADVMWMLFLAQNGVLLCLPDLADGAPRPTRRAARTDLLLPLMLGAGAAVVSLIKFTMLPVAFITIGMTVIALTIERQSRRALAHLAGFVLGFVVLWIATGQALGNLAGYVSAAAEVAAGYGTAMGVVPALQTDLLGFASMAISGAWLGWQILVERRGSARSLLLFALGCMCYVAWRQGFTRADAHIHQSFPLLALAPLLGVAVIGEARTRARLAGWGAALLALAIGLTLVAQDQPLAPARWTQTVVRLYWTMHAYSQPRELLRQRESMLDQARSAHPLPRARERIGNAGVDIINWEQGVLILHELNYQPRPVFQSYSAYTPRLMRLNEAHLLKSDAPRYVLLKLQAFDGRLPSGEDALALIALLRAYAPVLEEGGYLLFERASENAFDAQPELAMTSNAELGEWFEIPAEALPVTIATRLRPSIAGRLYAFWFRTPPLWLEVETASGVRTTHRLQPEAASAGLLISPLVRNNDQLAALYLDQPPDVVTRARVLNPMPQYSMMWESRVDVGFGTFHWLRPRPDQIEGLRRDTVSSGFSAIPRTND